MRPSRPRTPQAPRHSAPSLARRRPSRHSSSAARSAAGPPTALLSSTPPRPRLPAAVLRAALALVSPTALAAERRGGAVADPRQGGAGTLTAAGTRFGKRLG